MQQWGMGVKFKKKIQFIFTFCEQAPCQPFTHYIIQMVNNEKELRYD